MRLACDQGWAEVALFLFSEAEPLTPASVQAFRGPTHLSPYGRRGDVEKGRGNLHFLSNVWLWRKVFLPPLYSLHLFLGFQKSISMPMTPKFSLQQKRPHQTLDPNSRHGVAISTCMPYRRLKLNRSNCLISHMHIHTCFYLSLTHLGKWHHGFSRDSSMKLLSPPWHSTH